MDDVNGHVQNGGETHWATAPEETQSRMVHQLRPVFRIQVIPQDSPRRKNHKEQQVDKKQDKTENFHRQCGAIWKNIEEKADTSSTYKVNVLITRWTFLTWVFGTCP